MKRIVSIALLIVALLLPASAMAGGPQAGPPNKWNAYYLQDTFYTPINADEEFIPYTNYAYQFYNPSTHYNDLRWWAEDYADLDNYVATAIGRWKAISGYPQYLNTQYQSTDPTVGVGALVINNCGAGAYACASPASWNYHNNVHVNTVRKWYLYFQSDWASSSDTYKKGTATHEWGHVLGLGELYYTVTGCSVSASVMCRRDNGTHSPSSIDRDNLLTLHLGGSHDSVGAWYDSGSDRLITEWRNKSLSEISVVIDHYWSTSGGPSWIYYKSTLHSTNNGADYVIDGETGADFRTVFNPPGMGSPTNVYVMACSYPSHGVGRVEYYEKDGLTGNDNYRCSAHVYFPN